jgi:ABC-type amino acid transport substrate-binding protein
VVQTGITRELLGICVRRGDDALKDAINEAQRALVEDGTLSRLVTKRLGPGASAAGSR